MATNPPTVVLIHGAFVDGSGWRAVHDLLDTDSIDVRIVQNPTTTLADDVAATRRVIDDVDGPVVLVGHSYGGAVISEAGTDERVVGLVFVAAFAPDRGESVAGLIGEPPPDAPAPPILPPVDGFLLLDRAEFATAFAADVPAAQARFMARSQVPWGAAALAGTVTEPAWRTTPSWYVIATDDRMIPPAAQRSMAERAGATISEASGSHAIALSQPAAVADAIRAAVGQSVPA